MTEKHKHPEPDDYSKEVLQEAVESELDQLVSPMLAPFRRPVVKPIALVTWEDITAYTRVEIPEDFEVFRLTKITVGILWKQAEDYLVLVQDYDLSNRGKGFRHNDFHIIPRGAVKEIKLLGDIEL